jgi:hypothetical protein
VSSFEPSQRAHQLQPRREIARGFFVTGGDATELLDELEEAFDIPLTLPLII